jgi:hypothetical protein
LLIICERDVIISSSRYNLVNLSPIKERAVSLVVDLRIAERDTDSIAVVSSVEGG